MKNLILTFTMMTSSLTFAVDFPGFEGQIINYTNLDLNEMSVKAVGCENVRRNNGGIIISVPSGGGCSPKILTSTDMDSEGGFKLDPITCKKCRYTSIEVYAKKSATEPEKRLSVLPTRSLTSQGPFNLFSLKSPKIRAITDTGISLVDWIKTSPTVRGLAINYNVYTQEKPSEPILNHKDAYQLGYGPNSDELRIDFYQSPNRFFALNAEDAPSKDFIVKAEVRAFEEDYGSAMSKSLTFVNEATFIQSPSELSLPKMIVETQNIYDTVNGAYTGIINPLYDGSIYKPVTEYMRISDANFNCENNILIGYLTIDNNMIEITNGRCDTLSAQFEVKNLPLTLEDSQDQILFSGKVNADKILHRYVSLEICNDNDQCIDASLYRKK